MQIILHKKFRKKYAKLDSSIKQRFKERRNLFLSDPFHPILNNHSVEPTYPGWRSINITGDYRVLYKALEDNTVVFMKIGTHSELYK